jgi:hypothetical protein
VTTKSGRRCVATNAVSARSDTILQTRATRPGSFEGFRCPGPGETETKKINKAKAWTSGEDERLRQLIVSNASVIDIAADLGRTVKAVRARAHRLGIALGRSRFRVKAK